MVARGNKEPTQMVKNLTASRTTTNRPKLAEMPKPLGIPTGGSHRLCLQPHGCTFWRHVNRALNSRDGRQLAFDLRETKASLRKRQRHTMQTMQTKHTRQETQHPKQRNTYMQGDHDPIRGIVGFPLGQKGGFFEHILPNTNGLTITGLRRSAVKGQVCGHSPGGPAPPTAAHAAAKASPGRLAQCEGVGSSGGGIGATSVQNVPV